jgi:hypothetical protein
MRDVRRGQMRHVVCVHWNWGLVRDNCRGLPSCLVDGPFREGGVFGHGDKGPIGFWEVFLICGPKI